MLPWRFCTSFAGALWGSQILPVAHAPQENSGSNSYRPTAFCQDENWRPMDWCQHASCVQVPLPLPQSKNPWFLASWDAALWCWTHKFGPFLRPIQKNQDCSLMPTQSLPVLKHRYIPNFGLGLCFGGRTGRVQCLCWTELKACDFSWLFDTCSNLIQKCVAKRKMKRAQICAKKPQIGAKTCKKPQI